jgi:hypothetical protein
MLLVSISPKLNLTAKFQGQPQKSESTTPSLKKQENGKEEVQPFRYSFVEEKVVAREEGSASAQSNEWTPGLFFRLF